MKAILRWGLGVLTLALISTAAHGYYWVTPVTRCPLPQAPSTWNSGYYLLDSQGRWTGPHYYLMPPNPPFNGVLPGPVGCAIMQGYLSHKLLMTPAGLDVGNAPLLPQRGHMLNFGGNQGAGAPPMGNPGMPPMPYMTQIPYGSMPNAGMAQYARMPYQPMATQQAATPYPQQNAWLMHNHHQAPFAPIPGFTAPGQGPMPPMPPNPPMPPHPNMTPMELPRMGPVPPPAKMPQTFPTHPFTRSPRDFFMWSETMEDEARLRNRPFPVPR